MPTRIAHPRRRRRSIAIAVAVTAGLCLTLLAGMALEARSLETHRVTLRSDDLPTAFDGLRIAFVSDIHHGPHLSRERVSELVRRINALQPDLVLLGGDYVHEDASYIQPVFAELGEIRAPLGVYGVLGNHDHWEGAAQVRLAMKTAGIEQLDNRGVWLRREDERIRIGGLGDLWEDEQDLSAALGAASDADFALLLTHNPDAVESLDHAPVDLALAGHTHGGQVTLFGLWAPVVPSDYGQRYRSGLVRDGPVPVLVSTGVGSITPPLRFFARPEIVLLTLRSGSGADCL